MEKSSFCIRRITISAVFLSISLILKTLFNFHIPIFGQNGMSIGISGIFSIMPSILFGPVYGAITSGLSDFLGYLMKPAGPYVPLLTLTAAAGGFIRGALWFLLRNRDSRKMQIIVAMLSLFMLISGVCNAVSLSEDDVTKGLIGSAAFGIVLLVSDLLISKKFLSNNHKGQIMQLLVAMIASGLLVTTFNTIVLRETVYTSWKLLPFTVVWLPRVIEEILVTTIKAYFVAILLNIFNRQQRIRALLS